MAGIGPVSKNREDVLRRAERQTALTASANELEIFYNLCVGRVHYKSVARMLYFVDSNTVSVTEIIHQVFRGLQQTPVIKQLYMDQHQLIKAASCIHLTRAQARAVLVALRLRGIHVDIM